MSMITTLEKKGIKVPDQIKDILNNAPKVHFFNTTDELIVAATNGADNATFEVKYDVPGKGEYVEAIVHKVSNGISANYTEAYMRRRDPNSMLIADDKPTDKTHYKDVFGKEFPDLR